MNASDAMAKIEPDDRRATISSDARDGRMGISSCDAGGGLRVDGESVFQLPGTTKQQGLGLKLASSRSNQRCAIEI